MFPTREALPVDGSDDDHRESTGSVLDGDIDQASVLAAAGIATAVVGGVCLAAVAAWLSSPSLTEEVGFLLVGLSLPLLLAGALRLVQLGVAARVAAVAGFAGTLGALVMFAAWFPDQWTTSLTTPNGYAVTQYGIGLLLMTAALVSTGAARIAEAGAQARRLFLARDEALTRQVEADLRRSKEESYTWGGVPTQAPSATLVLRDDVERFEAPVARRGDRILVEPADHVDAAVHALMGLRGRRPARRLEAPVAGQAASLRSVQQSHNGRWRSRPWWERVLPPYR